MAAPLDQLYRFMQRAEVGVGPGRGARGARQGGRLAVHALCCAPVAAFSLRARHRPARRTPNVAHAPRLRRSRKQNKVGGGEGVEGCYGTLTRAGVERVMGDLAANCGLGRGSVLVDIGAGIGRCGRALDVT